ncbi:MAG: hypothetical protein KDK62_05190, partial [Chlamydiia bacterium]|nr:hypothetical protein [Chlamydiia bacterium]
LSQNLILKSKKPKSELIAEAKLCDLIARLENDFEMVGSMVMYVLGVDYLEALLKPYHIHLSKELKQELSKLFPKGNDLDFRARPAPKTPLGAFQGQVCDAVSRLTEKSSWELSRILFQKLHYMQNGSFLIATLGDGEGHDVDFIIYDSLSRLNFASKDALRLRLSDGKVLSSGTSWLQPFLDQIFKTLRVDEPEKVDHNGWARLLSLRVKGFIPAEETLEARLLQTVLEKGDISFLVSQILNTAKNHLPGIENGALQMAYLGAFNLRNKVSHQDFAEFWELLLKEVPDTYGLGVKFSDPKTPSTEVFLLLQVTLPFHEDPWVKVSSVQECELQTVYKDYEKLKKAFKLIPNFPFQSLNALLFERLLKASHPYALWVLLKPHLSDEEQAGYNAVLKAELQGNAKLRNAFIEETPLAVAVLNELKNDEEFEPFFEELVNRALKQDTGKGPSWLSKLVRMGKENAERLKSHDKYAELILLALSIDRSFRPQDLGLSLSKISNPELQLKIMATLLAHKCPLNFNLPLETLESVNPNSDNDSRLRELFKTKLLNHIPYAFIIAWILKMQALLVKPSRPWLFLLKENFGKELANHKDAVEKILLNFLPYLTEDLKVLFEVMELAQIDSDTLRLKLAKVCSEQNDKSSREVLMKLLPLVKDSKVWTKALKCTSPAILTVLSHPLDFLSQELSTKLLEACLTHLSTKKATEVQFSALKALRAHGSFSSAWVKWLIPTYFQEATSELLFRAIPKDLKLWKEALFALSPDRLSEVYSEQVDALIAKCELNPEEELLIRQRLGQTDRIYPLIQKIKSDPSQALRMLISNCDFSFARRALIDPEILKKIPKKSQHELNLLLVKAQIQIIERIDKVQPLADMIEVILYDFYRIDPHSLSDEIHCIEMITKLFQIHLLMGGRFDLLKLNLSRISFYLSFRSLARTPNTPPPPFTLEEGLQQIKSSLSFHNIFLAQLPSLAHDPGDKEAEHLIPLALRVPSILLKTKDLSPEAKKIVARYAFDLLRHLLTAHPKLKSKGTQLLEELTLFIPPETQESFQEHFKECMKLFRYYLTEGPTTPEEGIWALKLRARLDPQIYKWELPRDFQPKQLCEQFPYVYMQGKASKSLQPSKVLVDEFGRLLDLKSPYAVFRAIQLFAHFPHLLFDYPGFSEMVWENLLVECTPFLTEKVGRYNEVTHFDIITFLVTAFSSNRFFERHKSPDNSSIKHIQNFFDKILDTYYKTTSPAILFSLFHILYNAILFKAHIGNEKAFLDMIEKLTPMGCLWLTTSKEDKNLAPLLKLITQLKLKDKNHINQSFRILMTWITSIKGGPAEMRAPLLAKIERALNKSNYKDFHGREILLKQLKTP